MSENVKKTNGTVKKTGKRRARKEEKLRKGLKNSSGFVFGLFVNILIVFLIVKLFTYAFNFAYGVFGSVAYHPGSQQYIIVDIPADASIMEIGEALQDAEIIEDKYVFYAKVKVKGYGTKITSGQYHLSASMTYDEILQIICNIGTSDDDEENK